MVGFFFHSTTWYRHRLHWGVNGKFVCYGGFSVGLRIRGNGTKKARVVWRYLYAIYLSIIRQDRFVYLFIIEDKTVSVRQSNRVSDKKCLFVVGIQRISDFFYMFVHLKMLKLMYNRFLTPCVC